MTGWTSSGLASSRLEEDEDVDEEDFRWQRPWLRPRRPLMRREMFPLEEVGLDQLLERNDANS